MTKIQAAVFDIDGTLIDTSEFIIQAYEYVIQKHGFPKRTRQEISSQIGKKIEDCYAFLTPSADYEELIADHSAFQAANLTLVKAFADVEQVLQQLKRAGIKVGLWTGRRHHVIESLEKAGLSLEMFGCIIDATMVRKGKPDPEGLFATLKQLGVRPDSAVMVGDAALDIQAGKAANVALTIGLTHGFGTRQELENASADYILDSLERLPDAIMERG